MQTPELASLAKGLLDAYPGLAVEVQRSQQTAAYNASVPGSSTTSNHLADGGHGALDLAGPKADALAANPTGAAANWIWERHDHHWHIEPKKPQKPTTTPSGEEVSMQDVLGFAAKAKTEKELEFWMNLASQMAEKNREKS